MRRTDASGRNMGASADFSTEPATLPTPRLALSIPEFCKAHSISEGFFYKLKKQGEGPREMKVGTRTLISLEAAAEWRRKRENRHGRRQSISSDNNSIKPRGDLP